MSISELDNPAIHYVTFGHGHKHTLAGRQFGYGCVACYIALNATQGRDIAFALFGPKFCFEYHGDEFDTSTLHFFPEGIKPVPQRYVESLPVWPCSKKDGART